MELDIETVAWLAAREAFARIWLHSVRLEVLTGVGYSFGAKAAMKGACLELDNEESLENAKELIGRLLADISWSEEDALNSNEESADSINALCDRLDAELLPLVARLQNGVDACQEGSGVPGGNPPSTTEAIRQALAAHGIEGNQVVSFVKRSLQERLFDRKKRRKWLRTPEGQAYLRRKVYRAKHVHLIDRKRSHTARMARRMYGQSAT